MIDILSRQSMLRIQLASITSIEFDQWCLNVLKKFRIMTDTQAIDVVTFDFKGTRVRCFVSGSTDYQMNLS